MTDMFFYRDPEAEAEVEVVAPVVADRGFGEYGNEWGAEAGAVEPLAAAGGEWGAQAATDGGEWGSAAPVADESWVAQAPAGAGESW